jgi:hypothetical protein
MRSDSPSVEVSRLAAPVGKPRIAPGAAEVGALGASTGQWILRPGLWR